MNKKLKALLKKKQELLGKCQALLDNAENDVLSAEEQTEFDGFETEIANVNASIERTEKMIALEKEQEPAAVADGAPADNTADADDADPFPNAASADIKVTTRLKPFGSFAEQLKAIYEAGQPGARTIDERLTTKAAAGASESVPSDGGFLVQSDFASEILRLSYGIGQILPRVRRVPISAGSNGLTINAIDESSRVTGSRFGGVRTYWEGEGDQATAKKPKFRTMDLKLKKLIGLMYMTDELLADAPAMTSIATTAFSEEIAFMTEEAVIEGVGAYQPRGMIDSPATITVAKESGQSADTVKFENISKMWARLWNRSRANAVWLINQDVLPQLDQLELAGTNASTPAYQQPTGLADEPYGRLKGRPVIESEHCQTLGDKNDIMLVDPTQYLLIDKGAPKQDVSIHVRFDYDETAFRIVYRVDGQPIWNKALTPKNGSSTVSPFINLAARA